MQDSHSLQGWKPELGDDLTLAHIIDMAFDYRGYITIVKTDGTSFVGYIFNRNPDVADPYIEYFDESGNGPLSLSQSEIRNIMFTGRDAAAGKSREAWVRRRDREKAKGDTRRSGDRQRGTLPPHV